MTIDTDSTWHWHSTPAAPPERTRCDPAYPESRRHALELLLMAAEELDAGSNFFEARAVRDLARSLQLESDIRITDLHRVG